MKDLVKYSELLSFYIKLFTTSQQKYLSDYFYNDLSFSEIAKKHHVSRFAVYDVINRAKKQLLKYEKCLHLSLKNIQREELYKQINNQKIVEKLKQIEKNI